MVLGEPDSKAIAYWQIDARKVKDHYMVNNTDSIYPFLKPVNILLQVKLLHLIKLVL
jgi:hypothetical protein